MWHLSCFKDTLTQENQPFKRMETMTSDTHCDLSTITTPYKYMQRHSSEDCLFSSEKTFLIGNYFMQKIFLIRKCCHCTCQCYVDNLSAGGMTKIWQNFFCSNIVILYIAGKEISLWFQICHLFWCHVTYSFDIYCLFILYTSTL